MSDVAAAFDKALDRLDNPLDRVGLEDVRQFVKLASVYHGDWQGMPVPVEGQRIILHERHPLQPKVAALNSVYVSRDEPEVYEAMMFSCHVDDGSYDVIVNSWRHRRLHAMVHVVKRKDGRACALVEPLPPDGSMRRLTLGLQTLGASDAWTLEAEQKAQEKLRGMLTDRQWRHYQLTGGFLETSHRSRVTYWLRRLRPTIALSERWPERNGQTPNIDTMRCLAVLCLHPVGYYENSWAGCMTPSDDVIAHLLLIRADEADYWGQANQHDPAAPEAGL